MGEPGGSGRWSKERRRVCQRGNAAVFNDKTWRPDEACTAAIREATEFLVANEGGRRPVGAGRVAAAEVQIQWRRPMNGWVKINFDGGLDSQMKSSGIGIIIRDSCGRFQAARAIHFGHLMEPVIIEAMAARESLIFAQKLGMQKVHIEGDSQQVVNMIQRIGDFITSVGVLIVDVNRLKQEFVGMLASFVQRGGNLVAHAVPKIVVRESGVRS
ncbi:hypothetical protein RHMOL_Rhmol05G0088400 [Rhododendron molle]|uniref:Uncharacterized protein n=1 Tax=Rhododendron molle TaxID=49168 RepID=A0ACC0NND3_RHOML|nr:hypothetical protein RHMOL_Rhmol05G0088400 [Rhododendron molle]